jgi:Type II/IV secretion system protein
VRLLGSYTLSDPHSHVRDSTDDLGFARMLEPSDFSRRFRVRYYSEYPSLQLAPPKRVSLVQFGEVRGGEAFDLLQLLNTGHSGSISTIHASSAKQALTRFTSCILQSGVQLPHAAIKADIGDSLNVIVQLDRRPGRRFISEVLEVNRYDPDTALFDYSTIYLAPRERT